MGEECPFEHFRLSLTEGNLMEKQTKYYELNLMQILRGLWHRAWLLLLAAVVGGISSFCFASFAITPKYESEALLYVNNSAFTVGSTSFSFSSSELSAAQSLVDTYIVILNTRSTLNEVIAETGVNYSPRQLKEMISSAAVDSTEVFSVKVTSTDPREAENIANAIAHVLPDRIAEIVDGSSVRIVDYAVVPSEKASPNITMFTAIGMLIGLAIACIIVIVKTATDTLIHSEDYLMQTYQLPVLTVVPDLLRSGSSGYYAKNDTVE